MPGGPYNYRERKYDNPWNLTPVEMDVLKGIARGWSNVGIAEDRVVTVRAVEKIVTSVLRKVTGFDKDEVVLHRRVAAAITYWEHTHDH